jgi:hypothetical protein
MEFSKVIRHSGRIWYKKYDKGLIVRLASYRDPLIVLIVRVEAKHLASYRDSSLCG